MSSYIWLQCDAMVKGEGREGYLKPLRPAYGRFGLHKASKILQTTDNINQGIINERTLA